MSYEGFGMVAIPDVEVPGDVADELARKAAIYGVSPGELIARLAVNVVRMEKAGRDAGQAWVIVPEGASAA